MKKVIGLMLILTACLQIAFQQKVVAQEKSKPEKDFKNTVHINLTNPLIFGDRSIIFGYERVLNKRQSFSINIGQTDFPSLNIVNSDSLKTNSILGQKGMNVSADYRFYLSKENKYNAPRGVYIGPYYSFNNFEKEHSWTVKSTSGGAPQVVESKTSLTVHTLGFEMGYQFIFWKRVALDMVLAGPGVSNYDLKATLGTNLSEADKQKLYDKLNQALAEKFPGYSWTVGEGDFQRKGSANTTSFGFRYMVQVGFRF